MFLAQHIAFKITMNIWPLILAFLLSAIISWCIIPRVILISYKNKWFDPSECRKVHKGNIPRLGGVAFTPSVVISTAVVLLLALPLNWDVAVTSAKSIQLALIFGALVLIYFSGITDDISILGYRRKFLSQFISAGLIVVSGIWVNDFYGLFGLHEIPWYFGQPFTALLIVFMINAMNMIDGIDGLASGLSMIALLYLGALFCIQGDALSAIIDFSLLGALLPFFYYNVFGKENRRNKIFMGDCGSMVLGLIIGLLSSRIAMSDGVQILGIEQTIALGFSVIIIPCLDVWRVMACRIKRKQSPFLPDKNHIHHLFLEIGISQTTTLMIILMLDICFVFMNLALVENININIIFALDIFLYVIVILWLKVLAKHKKV